MLPKQVATAKPLGISKSHTSMSFDDLAEITISHEERARLIDVFQRGQGLLDAYKAPENASEKERLHALKDSVRTVLTFLMSCSQQHQHYRRHITCSIDDINSVRRALAEGSAVLSFYIEKNKPSIQTPGLGTFLSYVSTIGASMSYYLPQPMSALTRISVVTELSYMLGCVHEAQVLCADIQDSHAAIQASRHK